MIYSYHKRKGDNMDSNKDETILAALCIKYLGSDSVVEMIIRALDME